MVAAKRGHKEALLALLQPFIVFPNEKQLDKLLHHENRQGQRLLAYVSYYEKALSVVHGILIELETFAHKHDSYDVKKCLRTSLGSTMNAKWSTDHFKRIRHRTTGVNVLVTFVKILTTNFLLRMCFLLLDVYTDVLLVVHYYQEWHAEKPGNM